jgi:DNA-binding SARP family transcriptional activator
VELCILGPVELWIGERRWELGGPKEQCALAILVMSAGRTVSAATLGERIWGDESPNRARETLHAYISRLRRHLRNAGLVSPMILTSSAQGYRLDVPQASIDVARFELLVQRAEAVAETEPREAVDLLPASGPRRLAPACSNAGAPRCSAGSGSSCGSAGPTR